MDSANPRTPGRSPNRREVQSVQTRALIVETAREQFAAGGYAATTIESIATGAGVAIQTIYNSVGNKPALLSAVLDAAVSGPNAPTPVPEFLRDRAAGTGDFAGMVGMLADWFAEAMPRSQGIFAAIGQAAAVEPSVAALRDQRARQRLDHYLEAAAAIRQRGGLGSGMSDDDAAAVIFTIGNPDTYASLVVTFGWPLERYRNWVFTALVGALR
ncbi:TetR/AcrR family transcriptional regulator [Arthrobacter livingstonensis]|uniref:TetR/AcrR family transcriptional regulator n=1 Tax=Arthrobacter livingstonensis TaxID=670078 RepID=A0A2V5L4Z9_9MICC|nr:TetR/AcrR family transcriptional regulator [Arthrobacter livingstonensis]PYI66449.1 TetR/AcrR family transcriptional regulator [Arthrobacter livingstonensis]